MNEQDIIDMLKALEVSAREALRLLHAVDPIDGYEYLTLDSISTESVCFAGSEPYQCGDHFFEEIPLGWVLMPAKLAQALKEREQARQERLAKEAEAKARKEASKMFLVSRADYERLQALKAKEGR